MVSNGAFVLEKLRELKLYAIVKCVLHTRSRGDLYQDIRGASVAPFLLCYHMASKVRLLRDEIMDSNCYSGRKYFLLIS